MSPWLGGPEATIYTLLPLASLSDHSFLPALLYDLGPLCFMLSFHYPRALRLSFLVALAR